MDAYAGDYYGVPLNEEPSMPEGAPLVVDGEMFFEEDELILRDRFLHGARNPLPEVKTKLYRENAELKRQLKKQREKTSRLVGDKRALETQLGEARKERDGERLRFTVERSRSRTPGANGGGGGGGVIIRRAHSTSIGRGGAAPRPGTSVAAQRSNSIPMSLPQRPATTMGPRRRAAAAASAAGGRRGGRNVGFASPDTPASSPIRGARPGGHPPRKMRPRPSSVPPSRSAAVVGATPKEPNSARDAPTTAAPASASASVDHGGAGGNEGGEFGDSEIGDEEYDDAGVNENENESVVGAGGGRGSPRPGVWSSASSGRPSTTETYGGSVWRDNDTPTAGNPMHEDPNAMYASRFVGFPLVV